MSKKLWDVIIVGGGPAGITTALRLAREELDVLVVEAGVYAGAENWSGAVYFAEQLADPKVLGEDELERAPYERRVVKRGFFTSNGWTLAGVEYRNVEAFRHCYTVLRPVYDRYLAERARELGATILNATTVDGLIRQGGRVIGVHSDRGPIYGDVVFLAEGDASHLVSKEGFEGPRVRSKQSGQPAFLQGVKEVIELSPDLIEERFRIQAEEAACYEILLRNSAIEGRPVRLNMAGLVYTNRASVSIGLVMPLDNLAAYGGDYNNLMEWFKDLPPIRQLIQDGESTSYGAKIIRSGGLHELPQLVDHGVAIGGAATGIGVDFPYPNYTGPATAMGKIFAEAVLELRRTGDEPTRERLEELYVEPLKATHYYKNVEQLRDWPAYVEQSEALCGRQIDLINGSIYMLTRRDLRLPQRWWQFVRLVCETLKGKWRTTIADVRRGARALHVGRYVLKHFLPAVALSIPNTLCSLVPIGGRPVGHLRSSFWARDERTGKRLRLRNWFGARFTGALSRAAEALYANDDRTIGAKLDRAVGLVMRKISLWDPILALIGGLAFLLTRIMQRLSDLIRYAVRKPTLAELQSTYYARWQSGWRSLTGLTPSALGALKSHDAKLGEITYASEAGSHIKVFFAPAQPGRLEDPSQSALWHVCPAAVYQINVDRTMHASAVANFENCVKCETCWRIEPQHVDWTRFGDHRLVYEVYTQADGALRRALSERKVQPALEIEPSYWTVTLSEQWPSDRIEAAREDLQQALTAAHRAIGLARAKCSELREDVWQGPRVLEPGQVAWYRSAIEYCTHLAESAAAQTTSEPIENWLVEHELGDLHMTLLGLRRDLGTLSSRAREHAAAQRFFAAEADTRQLRDHHLAGLAACLTRIAEACLLPAEIPDPVEELRSLELDPPARVSAREALRAYLAETFDRGVIRRLEHGGALENHEVELLRDAARAALGARVAGDGFTAWERLTREDILAELARIDSSLAAIVAGHLAAADALARAGAPQPVLDRVRGVEHFATVAFEAEAGPGEDGWHGRLPFVFSALADSFVGRGGGRVALFDLFAEDAKGVAIHGTPAIGLTGAGVSEVTLDGARPTWVGDWSQAAEAGVFGMRARDVAAIALGASTLVGERAVEHAGSRIQFPGMFQDLDGRDAVGKFGAVRAHLAHLEAARLAVETLLRDAVWTEGDDGLEALVAKVAVTDLFGPDMPSITYRAGQVIGGSAFSEEDVFSKIYRDSSLFPHYIRENALLNVAIGARLSSRSTSAVEAMSADVHLALRSIAERPILDFEVKRLREAEERLGTTVRRALERGAGKTVAEVIHDISGELASRLYVWARLLVRAHRRLDGALPAQRYVEAAQLWADIVEERLVALDQELEAAGNRVELGGHAFQLEGYPDTPIATDGLGFDYERDIVKAERGYKSGDFLLRPLDLDAPRYLPELVWADGVLRAHYEEYLKLFRERFVEGGYEPSFERHIERLHYIPRQDIEWTRDQGFFRVVIPKGYGGQGRWKADYYSLCQVSKRLADVSHTLTIQANTSIGTTPMLLGLYQDVAAAERELQGALQQADAVEGVASEIKKLLGMMERSDLKQLEDAFVALNKDAGAKLGRGRILKKVVFGKFLSQMRKAGAAGMQRDLDGFRAGLEKALAALEGWRERVSAELDELPRRRLAHEFYLRLIAARMISAFTLTEPSAGSDTARIRTQARLDSRRVHTDPDGVKYFYLDEEEEEGRRNLADMRRFEFDGPRILYRCSDDAEPAEVICQEYTYEEGEERYRYFMIGDRRVDIHDMAIIRERDGAEYYEFFVLNGAKMWSTNGHIAGVHALYAVTPMGVTGFMVDALTDGFLVGKDEEKTGQRGSSTNEITLTNVRIPRECIIGIEGRGQENALETLNVGRTGLCVSSAAGMQQNVTDAAAYLGKIPRGSAGWARYRLGLALEEMFASEAIAHNVIGLFDDETSDALRMECAIAKLYGTDGAHRVLHYLEPVYGIEGQTQRYRIEKERRDARVLTIYEGTNEIQQFLLVRDLVDSVGPKLEGLEGFELSAEGSPYADEIRVLAEMHAALRERVTLTRKTYKQAAWQRVLFQPIFFRLSRMAALVKLADSTVHRAHWIARNLTADGDEVRRTWCAAAARGFVACAQREFQRLTSGFDRDFETLRAGGRPAELKLAETLLDETEAQSATMRAPLTRIERAPIDRDLGIVVALEHTPRLAPRPRLEEGRVAEHVFGFSAGDRRALRLALALKSAAPERVQVTLVCAAPTSVEEGLRFGLAAGADRAILLDTDGEPYAEHAVADAIAEALRTHGVRFDLTLCGGSADSPSGGRLALKLASALAAEWMPELTDIWITDGAAVYASERFPCSVRTSLPAVAAVAAAEGEPEWEFSTAGFSAALGKELEVVPFPSDAEVSDEEIASAAAAVTAEAEEAELAHVDPQRAAQLLIEVGDLGDGVRAPVSSPYEGEVLEVGADRLTWQGMVFVPELADDDLARAAQAPLAAAQAIAAHAFLPLSALVLTEPLNDERRRLLAGRLMAAAPLTRIIFAEHAALGSGAPRAYTEALVQMLGPQARSRPDYLVSSPWLAEALPVLADLLRRAGVPAEELAGVNRIEFPDGDQIAFVRPVHERKLRARRLRALRPDGMRIVWCESEVGAEAAEAPQVETQVTRVALDLEYDPEADALARALAEARERLGVVTLENAEFVIDVGAGLGSVDSLETVVEPLRQTLLELGAPHVEIGATRKVTMDNSWLPDEHQIGQTGVRVNPRVMIALGVSGAPQHIDWVGDRAVIFAFNMDAQAPLMTLNQRRERPKVYPVVGNLFDTVPKFIAALKARAQTNG